MTEVTTMIMAVLSSPSPPAGVLRCSPTLTPTPGSARTRTPASTPTLLPARRHLGGVGGQAPHSAVGVSPVIRLAQSAASGSVQSVHSVSSPEVADHQVGIEACGERAEHRPGLEPLPAQRLAGDELVAVDWVRHQVPSWVSYTKLI